MSAGAGPTRVLVNLTWLVPGVVGGSEQSLTDALRAIAAEAPADLELRLAVLEPFLRAHPDLAEAFDCTVLGLDGRDKVRRVAAEQTWLVAQARRHRAQVVHHAGGVVPLVHPGAVMLTVQDLQPLDMPGNFGFAKRTYIRTMIGRSVRAARVVCVPSGFTRDRVVALLGAPPGSVRVVPWFPQPVRHDPDPQRLAVLPDGTPYLLYPAITYPHKNHLVLLDAFARLRRAVPGARLVLTGGEGPDEGLVAERLSRPDLGGAVLRTGRVEPARLEQLYRDAAAVVVPSRYEGFGLPALEAMHRGCPVLASRAGSLPEVCRPEDLLDPDDVAAWSDAMQNVLTLPAHERAARVQAGKRLADAFTPEATAHGLLDAYRLCADPTTR